MLFDIALVIPALNEEGRIGNTLSAFAKESSEKIAFIVVDNGSTDRTQSEVAEWAKINNKKPLTLLVENKAGSLNARLKGLFYAKKISNVVIGTDADCWPLKGFYKDIYSDFVWNDEADVLKGAERQDSNTRLLKHLFLPRLMGLIAWQEKVEVENFGEFFFGGYYGIKSKLINSTVFSKKGIPVLEPSVFWSRHCNYMGYEFVNSKPNLRTSSRRFWTDPDGFISGKRNRLMSELNYSDVDRVLFMKDLSKRESQLLEYRQRYFSERLLLFLFEALYFRKKLLDKTIIDNVITKAKLAMHCSIEDIDLNSVAGSKIFVRKYKNEVYKTLKSKYEESLKPLE